MKNDRSTGDRATKWIRWIARIWSLPIIAYSLMLLAGYAWSWVTTGRPDPYAVEDVAFVEALPPIFIFLSVLGLAIAWRWEGLGAGIAIAFQLLALLLLVIQAEFVGDFYRAAMPFLVLVVVAIPGILFLVCWLQSRRPPTSQVGS